ncbi:MAG: M36 family metallopeptidase [Thermoanaerobaculia bacterium]
MAATRAAAIQAPDSAGKSGNPQMADARVDLRASFKHATEFRSAATAAGLSGARNQAVAVGVATEELKKTLPGLEVRISNLTGAATMVSNKRGSLTVAAPGRGSESIVREFLATNRGLYGLSAADLSDLVVLGDSPGGSSGLRMLRLEQRINGQPVFQSETRFILARDGRLIESLGTMVPQARVLAPVVDPEKLLTPAKAIERLLASVGKIGDPAAFTITSQTSARIELAENDDYVAGPVVASRVLFPLAPGLLVPAWSLTVFTTGPEDWYALVDAETGDILWRKNIRDYASTHDARFRVFVQADGKTPADSPAPQSPSAAAPGSGMQFPEIPLTIVNMSVVQDILASPNGWINDCPGGVCTANETQTLGNNAIACMDALGGGNANVCDTSAAFVVDGNGRPTGNPDGNARNRDFLGMAPRDFQTNFLPPPQGGNPEAGQTTTGNGTSGTAPIDGFRRGAITQLFYITNWYHDQLFKLGFDEAAGNFQQTNFSGMGLGNDRVNADAQDNSGTNNANFATPPDGTSGRMQMFRFTGPTIDRDGGLDAEIVMHELSHGTSNRLVGNAAGLNWDPARGMGEGWSDFYALSLLNNTNADNPDARYASGAYATYKLLGLLDNYVYGIRRFPYSSDITVNPMTWADVDDVTYDLSGGIASTPLPNFTAGGAMEVHNSGEIWALTLWDVRSRVIADPAGANGVVPTGNSTMLQLVTDGLKMTPINPNFTDARDAILGADCATNACANESSIWNGFAHRGLGYGARAPYRVLGRYVSSHEGIHESFQVPFLDVVNPLTDVTIDDSATNSNGAIEPGEPIRITVKLTNPWRGATRAVAAATATLATVTPGITVTDASSTYGAIAPQGTATGDTFQFSVSPSVVCGSSIDFTITTVSTLGTTVASFSLRVGSRNGTDAVVTYTGDPNPDLVIVDGTPRGVFHQISVTDDFEISKLTFRVGGVTHPGVGDLSMMLRSPGGIGADSIALIDGLNDLGGTSIVNMVIDDTVPLNAANDMVQATTASAPYTKSWTPVYNAPWAALVNPALPADPVGMMTKYNGTSTKGTWTALASDVFSAAQGGTAGNGTFQSWSILVTPVHFDCAAVTVAATHYTVVAPPTATVGTPFSFTVTAQDAFNGTVTGYSGIVHFTSSDGGAALPADTTLVSGVGTFNATLGTFGGQTITATDTVTASITGTSGTIVTATPVDLFRFQAE